MPVHFSSFPGETLPEPGDPPSAAGTRIYQGGEEATRQRTGGPRLQRPAAEGADQ